MLHFLIFPVHAADVESKFHGPYHVVSKMSYAAPRPPMPGTAGAILQERRPACDKESVDWGAQAGEPWEYRKGYTYLGRYFPFYYSFFFWGFPILVSPPIVAPLCDVPIWM